MLLHLGLLHLEHFELAGGLEVLEQEGRIETGPIARSEVYKKGL